MNNLDFGLHFAEHPISGIAFILLSLLVNLLVMRRYIYSLFDPLLFYTILSAMAGAVVLYLAYHDLIRPFYLASYLATQVAFIGGFLVLRPAVAARRRPPRHGFYSGPIRTLYPLSVVLFVGSQLAVYAVSGIPLFLESRLEAFAGGGGYGLLSRIIYVTSTIAIVVAVYRLLLLQRKALVRGADMLVVLFCITVAILSGSKGALLALTFTVSLAFFFARRFHRVERVEARMRRFFLWMLGLSFPAALAAIAIQSGLEDVSAVVAALVMRFVQTGDIFFMLYPNDIIARLPDANGLLALFYSPLGSLRLVDREHLPLNLGLQAFWYHYDTELLSGPNARHNVFGLLYFGPILSVPFSFLLGLTFSALRNGAYRRLPATPTGMVVYALLAGAALFIEQDVAGQAIDYLFSIVLVLPPLYGFAMLLHFPARGVSSVLPARPALA